VVALTGYRNVAHVRPGVRPIRFRTLFVNKSYRRYALYRTTSVVAYVRQTIVNSHPSPRWLTVVDMQDYLFSILQSCSWCFSTVA